MKKLILWSWKVNFGKGWELCHWAEPTKQQLLSGGKPSPEAKAVRVKVSVYKNKRNITKHKEKK